MEVGQEAAFADVEPSDDCRVAVKPRTGPSGSLDDGIVDFPQSPRQKQHFESDENLESVAPDPGDAEVEKPADAQGVTPT
jgi:hypothetical protein